jgi:sarcosine oxidase, subunit gamma
MAELTRTHPLRSRLAALAAAGVTVEPFVAMVDVRGTPEVAPNTWADAHGGRAIWLGPDEWLLTSATEAPEELRARARTLGDAVTDVSAQRITLRVTGDRARDVLATGCAIDLHPRAFPRGASAQSTLGHAGVILLAHSDTGDDYRVLVRSSFAGYLADWLLDATLEFR